MEEPATFNFRVDNCVSHYPEDGGSRFYPKRWYLYNKLHDIMAQKIVLIMYMQACQLFINST
jgi:hypothetical protein